MREIRWKCLCEPRTMEFGHIFVPGVLSGLQLSLLFDYIGEVNPGGPR